MYIVTCGGDKDANQAYGLRVFKVEILSETLILNTLSESDLYSLVRFRIIGLIGLGE